jgi:DNA-binding MarR family transcriptional regulator
LPADRERGLPRQQSQSGSLPPVRVEVGRFHAFGASETALVTAPFSIGVRLIVAIDYIRNGYIISRMSKSRPQLPLTPAVFHILLALFGKERHGYDIMQQVRADSGDAVKMGPGTLYGSLDRMIEAGLVAKGNTQDPRRIYYRLTALGQTTLRAETERLSRAALLARRQLGSA